MNEQAQEEYKKPMVYDGDKIRDDLYLIPDEFIIEEYRKRMLRKNLNGEIDINNGQASFGIKNLAWPNGKFAVEIHFIREIIDAKTQRDI